MDFDLKNKKVKYFGLKVETGIFKINNKSCIAPNSLVLSYALALSAASSNSLIYLAGIDGYKQNINKNKEIAESLELFTNQIINKDIVSITPSIFQLSR